MAEQPKAGSQKATFFQHSFKNGEISPDMYARSESEEYQNGAYLQENWLITATGALVNRPGFRLLSKYADGDAEVAILPFSISSKEAFLVVISTSYIRIMNETDNSIAVFASPYTNAQILKEIKSSQNDNALILTHPDYITKQIIYFNNEFSLSDYSFINSLGAPTNIDIQVQTNSNKPFDDAVKIEYFYAVAAVTNKFAEGLLAYTPASHNENWSPLSEGLGHTNKIIWQYPADGGGNIISKFHVYRLPQTGSSAYVGYIDWNSGTIVPDQPEKKQFTFYDLNYNPDYSIAAPNRYDPFAGGNYPACSCAYGQRMIFAAPKKNKLTLIGSWIGSVHTFDYTQSPRPNEMFEFTLIDKLNEIYYLTDEPTLMALTSGGLFTIVPASKETLELAPEAIIAQRQTDIGCANLMPLFVDTDILYVPIVGNSIYASVYNIYVDKYKSSCIVDHCQHLFSAWTIIDWAKVNWPCHMIFALLSNGEMRNGTYQKDSKINGWGRIITGGYASNANWRATIRAVASYTKGNSVYVFAAIRRYNVNDPDPGHALNTIEFMKISKNDNPDILNPNTEYRLNIEPYLDFSISRHYDNPVAEIHGGSIAYYNGMTVTVIADGNIIENVLVENSSIRWGTKATDIIIGLPYHSNLITVPPDPGVMANSVRSYRKAIKAASLFLHNSRGVSIGTREDKLRDLKIVNPQADNVTEVRGQFFVPLAGEPHRDPTLYIRQAYPLRAEICGVSTEFVMGDTLSQV